MRLLNGRGHGGGAEMDLLNMDRLMARVQGFTLITKSCEGEFETHVYS